MLGFCCMLACSNVGKNFGSIWVFSFNENVSIFFQVYSSLPLMAGPEQLMVQEMVHSCVCWAGFPVKGQENIFSQCFV